MRKLNTIQKRNNLNEVFAADEKGPGGANHKYHICMIDAENDNIILDTPIEIQFQMGPRKEQDSTHGILDGDLLEIVRDRLKGFQEGEYATEYNAKALEHVELALMYLNRRIEDRAERNVLGTYNK